MRYNGTAEPPFEWPDSKLMAEIAKKQYAQAQTEAETKLRNEARTLIQSRAQAGYQNCDLFIGNSPAWYSIEKELKTVGYWATTANPNGNGSIMTISW